MCAGAGTVIKDSNDEKDERRGCFRRNGSWGRRGSRCAASTKGLRATASGLIWTVRGRTKLSGLRGCWRLFSKRKTTPGWIWR